MASLPFSFDDPILQRAFEETYKKIGMTERDRDRMLADLSDQVSALRKRISQVSVSSAEPSGTVLPIPQNLATVKVGFFGLASVDSFKFASHPGLSGYEFFADNTTPLSPDSDRMSDSFNLVHRGVLPWCIYWCGLDDTTWYVKARTYGTKGSVSLFTEEASTSDKPDTPGNVTAVQNGGIYYVLGQPRGKVTVSWDEVDDPYVIGYDVKEVLEP